MSRAPMAVARLTPDDHAGWYPLFAGYATFYQTPLASGVADVVWQWLVDPHYPLTGLIARDESGAAVGLAHYRACPRPLAGEEIGFLDDLYVAEAARGTGAADALFDALAGEAERAGWAAIRWLTQHYNARGRAFYDRYTHGASDFILYHWALGD